MLSPLVLAALLLQDAPEPAPRKIAPGEEVELIRDLANPLSALLSISLFNDLDFRMGPEDDGGRFIAGLLPQVPLHLGDRYNLLSRSYLPVVYQTYPGGADEFGVGDLLETLYAARAEPGPRGWVGGLGPSVRVPVGEEAFTMDQWQLGPSIAFVKQQDALSFGVIANHLSTVAGSERLPPVSVTTAEPFIRYITRDLWTLSLQSTLSFDWRRDEWSIPVLLSLQKLTTFAGYPVHVTFGIRYWAESRDSDPHDVGLRFGLTFILPR